MRILRWTLTPALLAPLVLLTSACEGSGRIDQSDLPPDHRVAERYHMSLHVRLDSMTRRPTGLYVQDLVIGDGARVDSGDVVTVHYTGWLPNGNQFDTSRDGEPFETAIGYHRVIDGWDQGVVGMRVGGRRRLVVPPALGYGSQARGPIPRNSTLVFEVEVVGIENRVEEGVAVDTAGS